MKNLLLALQFLTILPVNPFRSKTPKAFVVPKAGTSNGVKEKDFGASLIYFPIVGASIGLLLVLSLIIFGFLPHLVKVALVLITYVIITGAIHLEGFADTCDGFYAGESKEEVLAIMRDPHIGTMGVISLVCLLLFKFIILISIPKEILGKSLVTMVTFGRWSQVFACYASKYARQEGKARYFIEYAGTKEILLSTLFTLGLFLILFKIKGLVLFFASALAVFLFVNFVKKKIGGMTGDTIGAINEISEVGVLFSALFFHRL